MHSIVADIGNTRIKAGLFEDKKLVETHTFSTIPSFDSFIKLHPGISGLISNVRDEFVPEGYDELTSVTSLMLGNEYSTPQTLGPDRIAAAAGAYELSDKKDCLIIDAGTCITIDLVENGAYIGGSISPGIDMKLKAMNNYTGKLPLVSRNESKGFPGDSTQASMAAGAVEGSVAELDGIIGQYKEKFPGLKVFLTGGDYETFESKLKESIFVEPNLVLIGLNRIYLYNEE